MLGKTEGKRRIMNPTDMSLSKFREVVEDRGAWRAAVHGVTNDAVTQQQLPPIINI